jgi:hypothetical protein
VKFLSITVLGLANPVRKVAIGGYSQYGMVWVLLAPIDLELNFWTGPLVKLVEEWGLSRKAVEIAFEVLKSTWQFLDRPILLHKPPDISLRVTCCIILHNTLMADRVMEAAGQLITLPIGLQTLCRQLDSHMTSTKCNRLIQQRLLVLVVLVWQMHLKTQQQVTRKERFKELADAEEHQKFACCTNDSVR